VKARKPRLVVAEPSRVEDADVRDRPADFSDAHSQEVFSATVRVAAREMGRQAYRALRNGTVPR